MIQAWTSFLFTFIHVQSTYIGILLTAQTDFGLRSRTFSLKIISGLHFLKSLKGDNV